MSHKHATPVREEKSGRRQYHVSINPPLMASLLFALQHAADTMKNTIDDASYIVFYTVGY